MKIVTVVRANLATSPIGTDSRLASDLCGVPVLTRTLQRIRAADGVNDIVVVCPSEQAGAVGDLVNFAGVTVSKFDGPECPSQKTVRVARKWALHSWRGGMGNSCFFDEHAHPALYGQIAKQLGADAIISVAAEAPLIDPQLIDAMLAHYERESESAKMLFAQAPPGLAPTIFGLEVLGEVSSAGLSPGWVNSYRPDQPQRDMITGPACYRPPIAVQTTSGRLTSDTRRGFETLERLLDGASDSICAEEVCQRLALERTIRAENFPHEIQLELTTEDELSATILRPRGQAVGRRGPIGLELVDTLLAELCEYDDTLLVLGGFGEPLLHPQFPEILRKCRESGVFGLAVRTNAIALNEGHCTAILDAEVDVVQIFLDANNPKKYKSLHGCDHWDTVIKNIEMLNQARIQRKMVNPILAATLMKTRETLDLIDEFYDRWLQYSGCAIIEGYSNHAGLLDDRRVMSMAPPKREPCRQLLSRCTILSDGTVVGCDQDFTGKFAAGSLTQHSLVDIWRGDRLEKLREAHNIGNYEFHPLCAGCDEWHRP